MKKIIRLTEKDLTRLVKKIINEQSSIVRNIGTGMSPEEIKNARQYKCSSFDTSQCTKNVAGDSVASKIVSDILYGANCLQYYYLTIWDREKIFGSIAKINSQEMYDKIEKTLKCFIKEIGWNTPEDSLLAKDAIIGLMEEMGGNHLPAMRVYKSYSKLFAPNEYETRMYGY